MQRKTDIIFIYILMKNTNIPFKHYQQKKEQFISEVMLVITT